MSATEVVSANDFEKCYEIPVALEMRARVHEVYGLVFDVQPTDVQIVGIADFAS